MRRIARLVSKSSSKSYKLYVYGVSGGCGIFAYVDFSSVGSWVNTPEETSFACGWPASCRAYRPGHAKLQDADVVE
jgi:hypothetical protein